MFWPTQEAKTPFPPPSSGGGGGGPRGLGGVAEEEEEEEEEDFMGHPILRPQRDYEVRLDLSDKV